MKITEVTRPSSIGQALAILYQHGYQKLGSGLYATVVAKPDEATALKLFSTNDTDYRAYLNLIAAKPNPHFPVIKGKPIKVSDEYWAIRMERLEPLEENSRQLIQYIGKYLKSYQKLAELEQEYYSKAMNNQYKLTDEDKKILDQLGEIPDEWLTTKFTTISNDHLGPKIAVLRQQVKAFDQYYPDLGEALRLIDKYVLSGMGPDLNPDNIMLRGSTVVITDPSSGGAEKYETPPMTAQRQPELFNQPKSWNDITQNIDRKALSYKLPNELEKTPDPVSQARWGL